MLKTYIGVFIYACRTCRGSLAAGVDSRTRGMRKTIKNHGGTIPRPNRILSWDSNVSLRFGTF